MSKWSGVIGFKDEFERSSSIWVEDIIEKEYYGDIIKNYKFSESVSEINDSININNQFSVISDPYALENFHKMIYITYMGTKWKIRNVEIQYPRVILGVGGVYNEENQARIR